MSRGSITKLVNTFGSSWGLIRGYEGLRDVFFNVASLEDPTTFSSLKVGQAVEFDEQPDYVNGSHAKHIVQTSEPEIQSGSRS